MHPQRERALRARDLVVIQLERVDDATAELVVAGKGTKDGGQEHTGTRSRRNGHSALHVF